MSTFLWTWLVLETAHMCEKNFYILFLSHVRQKSRLITCIHILSPGCYLGFKIWTSGYMIFVLHRYKQWAQYNHSNRLYPRPPHVATATCTILILVSFFISFYCLSSILSLCVTVIVNAGQKLMETSVLLAPDFPAFSPFVLISSDTGVSRFFYDFCSKKIIFLILLNIYVLFLQWIN